MNTLIVESKNDKAFVEATIRAINTASATDIKINVDTPICNIDTFECLEGLDEKKLSIKIQDILTDARVSGRATRKLGILIDLDQYDESARIAWLNAVITSAFRESGLSVVNVFSTVNELKTVRIDPTIELQLACHFTNHGGRGELETLLKAIKTKDSHYADCLTVWRDCIKNAGLSISDKEFDKFWLSNYVRFDTCSNKDRKQAGRKCSVANLDYVLENKADIFDFHAEALVGLTAFLGLFSD